MQNIQLMCKKIYNLSQKSHAKITNINFFYYLCAQILCIMQWNKDTLKEARIKAKLSQSSLADELGVHFRTVQNWEKGITSIPVSVKPALDKLLGGYESSDYVPREEYNRVVAALDATTELNRKLTDIIQSGLNVESKK